MKIHHLNCATQYLIGGCLVSGRGSPFRRVPIVTHCLLVETDAGLVLVDTGLGLQDIENSQRLGRSFRFLAQPQLNPEETALRQIQRLGYRPDDVRHVILTHLDLDHAGGLSDFPQAEVHLLEAEYQAGTQGKTRIDRYRYHLEQWQHQPRWVRYRLADGESWFGFRGVRQLQNLPPEILLVPLLGHTYGHAGIAIRTSTGWLFHAGDAYYVRDEIDSHHPRCPLGLQLVENLGAADNSARRHNQCRLRELNRDCGETVTVFCSHDRGEFHRLRDRSTDR